MVKSKLYLIETTDNEYYVNAHNSKEAFNKVLEYLLDDYDEAEITIRCVSENFLKEVTNEK